MRFTIDFPPPVSNGQKDSTRKTRFPEEISPAANLQANRRHAIASAAKTGHPHGKPSFLLNMEPSTVVLARHSVTGEPWNPAANLAEIHLKSITISQI